MNLSILGSGFATDIFERLAESLLHFVWQGSVLAVIVLIADRYLRGCSAQLRYSVHVTALLLMLACVPVTYAVLQQQPRDKTGTATATVENELAVSADAMTIRSDSPSQLETVAASGHPEIDRADPPQPPRIGQTRDRMTAIGRFAAPYAVVAYLLGVVLMFGRLAVALMGGHRLCSEALPVTESDLLSLVARQARKIGLRAAPMVAWCGRTSVPLIAGLIKPMILLPVALANSLTPDQLEALLAHELAHLRRFDLLVNLLQRVAEALLFFHPAVWYVSRRISSERENCCDDSVLRAGWGRVEYADALVRMAEICAPLRGISGVNSAVLLAAAGNNPSQFKRRILRLLGERETLRLGISRTTAVVILGSVLVVILAIPVFLSAPALVAENEKESPKETPAKNDREPETVPGHYRVSFQNVSWPDVLGWYGRVMGDRIATKQVPSGTFSHESPRPLDQRELSLLINSELLSRGYCLVPEGDGFSVQPAEVLARQYAEQLRKDFMHGHELRKGPDKFESYFELVQCRIVGRTRPPAPAGPAIAYVLKARRDFSAQEATTFFGACFADSSFPSLKTGELILADGFAVSHDGKWLGKNAPALRKGGQIEVWQNYAQEWNSRPPRDYHLVVRGLIVGPDGKPVAGARVQQLLLEGAPDGPEGEKLKAFLNWAYGGEPIVDGEGKFLISINQYSQFVRHAYFHVSAPGVAPQRVGPIAIDPSKPAVDLKVELKPGFSGPLRLVLPDGKPLDKGEVELTVQDDLWAWSQPMAKLPVIAGDPITVPNCPAGPLLLKLRVPGFVEQEVRDVVLVEDKVTEVKVAPKPLEPKPNDAKPKEVFYFRGKEALDRIETVKPKWGESQHDIEFGIARLDDKRLLHSDDRVRLELFIRNTGKETVKVEIAADFHANVPEIKDERGEAVKVEGIFLSGSVPLYRETLKPGEAFGFRHFGLGLGPRTWPPHWEEPKPGKYTLRHTHEIDVDPVDESKSGTRAKFTTGTIEFKVAAPVAAKAPDAEDLKVVPKPKEASYFRGKEALERIESVKPRWSQPQNDIEFGVGLIGERDRFYNGERVPLEMFVRNVGEKSVKVQLAAEFLANVPEVINEKGEAVKVESVLALGDVPLYRETLKPGEAFGFRHLGLGLGPNPTPKENWHPYWAKPTAHATLRYAQEIEVSPADESKPGERLKFMSWIHFDIAPADEAKPPRDGVHRYVPNPKQKDVVIEQSYKDGKLHGPTRRFVRGELAQEENYKEGKLDGFKRSFLDGKIAAETIYKDGKPEGVTFSRHRWYDGKRLKDVKFDGQYLNGKKEGTWTWELGGERVQVENYKDGLLHGPWERKSDDSKNVYRLTYDKGNIVNEGETIKAMPLMQKTAAQASGGDPLAKRIAAALQTDVDLDYSQTPIAEVVLDLHERFNMPMFVDLQAADVPRIVEKKITTNLKQTRLFLGLHEITTDHGLIFDYRFHSLWLTTPKAAAAWKDTTGVSDLKPAAGSPLAKALPELPRFDLLATPIPKLIEPFQKEYGLTLDASRATEAQWTGPPQPSRRESRILSSRDALSILLYQNNCRCREEGDKLIIEPLEKKP